MNRSDIEAEVATDIGMLFVCNHCLRPELVGQPSSGNLLAV